MEAALKEALDVEVELIKGSGGIFDVAADGSLLFSKHELGRYPEPEEVIDALRDLSRKG